MGLHCVSKLYRQSFSQIVLSLQHPQKVGACPQVQKGVRPPHDPPGDWLSRATERPAGRKMLPWHPFVHGSAVQHPTNFVPVSHMYLIWSESRVCEASNGHVQRNWRISRIRLVLETMLSDVPCSTSRAEEFTWLRCPVGWVCHVWDVFAAASWRQRFYTP